ncbi:protein rolling stone-like [Mizuhopecten yessoensis]|uniref:Protein rolling stone n=1 Tax=Mizuhopecten yessoensis TaxID=6573 RepID=A0A210PSQ8_MIZYE|nr:protein rolling stone-like [Mizuhopecten yessoensis]OWF39521.1 Protein rolling stone [Mizuhopecten yessoensis]
MESCTESLVQEFRPESLGLNHDNPSDFVRPQWPINQKIYVAYRLMIAAGMVGWIIADVMYETEVFYSDRRWLYLIYATNWSFILLGLTAIIQAVCVTFYSCRTDWTLDRQTFERMPRSLKLQWGLQNLSYNSAVVVTISYWGFLTFLDTSKILTSDMSRLKHTLNTTYVVLDLLISAAPVRLLHMLFAIMLGSIYSLFNAIYFLNDGTILQGRHYAYNVLNWENPAEAIVTCVLCIVQAILSQFILYEIYKLRSWIFSKTYFDMAASRDGSEMQSIMADSPKYMTLDEKREAEEHATQ